MVLTLTTTEIRARALPFRIAGTPRGQAHDWNTGARLTLREGQEYVAYSGDAVGIMRHADNPEDVELIALKA